MKLLLKMEEIALVFLGVFAYTQLGYPAWWFALLIFAPDLSMLGYLATPQIGAFAYNLVHHKAVAILIYVVGLLLAQPLAQLAGVILFTHASLDRVFGYGLKYADSFQNTHLGRIGPVA